MLEQDLYRVMTEFLADWARDQQAGFELFHVIGRPQDRGAHQLRELLTRFNVPFGFHPAGSEQGRRLLEESGLDASRLPVMIRHDGYAVAGPTPAQIIEATGGSIHNDIDECDVVIVGAGPAGAHRCRLCRVRGPADGGPGAGCFRRPGGKQPDDPELPGLPARHQRA